MTTTTEAPHAPAPSPGAPEGRRVRTGWSLPLPDRVPRPTWSPAALALGIVGVALGLVTNWIVLAAGGAVSLAAIAVWIRELRHDLA